MSTECEVCGAGPVVVKVEPITIPYGAGEDRVDISFTAEMVHCTKCGEFYSGPDYEAAETAAIDAHKETLRG